MIEQFITDIEPVNNLIDGFLTIQMFRAGLGGKRGYLKEKPFKIYSGLTGALSNATFKGHVEAKRLSRWRDKQREDLGSENADIFLNQMANFGTLTHEAIVRINKKGALDWREEFDIASEFFVRSAKNNNIPVNGEVIRRQVFEYSKSIASIMQFIYENVVKIHSVEGMAYCDSLEIATPIDFTCTMKAPKVADFISTLNLKTSAQFSDHQREQVAIEKYLWNKTYPDLQATKTGLLRAKDWNKTKGIPTYDLEILDDQIEKVLLKDAIQRLMLCKSNYKSTYMTYPDRVLLFTGSTKAGENPKMQYKTIEEMWFDQKNKLEESKQSIQS